MKKNIILLLIFTGLFASCDIQMDEVFDRTAAERVNAYVEEVYDVLTSAPNGWVMEYYPEENQKYGGVNILMSFDRDNGVVMINETAATLTATEKSTYAINKSAGAVLAFDTYNSYITYYADPGITLGDGKSKGFMGDLEFAVKSVSDSEIVLKGTKTQNRIIMKAIPANITWAEYVGKIQAIQTQVKSAYITRYEAVMDDLMVNLAIDPQYNLLSYTYEDEGGRSHTLKFSYMYTVDGIKFYDPVDIFGQNVQNFTWNKADLKFTCNDPGVTGYLEGKRAAHFREYDWYIGTWKLYSYTYATAAPNAGTANPVYTLTIKELERDKSFEVSGFDRTTSGATFDLPFVMNWSTDGRVSILGHQELGTRDVTISGTQYPNVPVYIYAVSLSGSYRTSGYGSGIISKTTLVDNRVDFENNGVVSTVVGVAYYFAYGPTPTYTSPGKFQTPMYMIKE